MTDAPCPGSWCEILRDRISNNISLTQGLIPRGRRLCAVLKADAYGHGIQQVVPLVQAQGVTCIGITSNAEARAVRDAGFAGTMIRLRAATPAEIQNALPHRVEEQVSSVDAARALRAIRDTSGATRAHLALNAKGMSRDGLEISNTAGREVCREILAILDDGIVGISTHFPSNTDQHLRQSADVFQRQVAWVFDNSRLDRSKVLVHAGSSLTLISNQQIETDMYRCGAIFYGILKPDLGFKTTMDLKSRIVSLGGYAKGSTVGYDRSHRLGRDSRLACISIGYANGIARGLPALPSVTIRNHSVPLIGKVSMNALVADVTDLPEARIGEEVIVFGGTDDYRTSLSQAEAQFGTIMADLYSDWGQRNTRMYL